MPSKMKCVVPEVKLPLKDDANQNLLNSVQEV